jgi:hypothetical protein
MPLPTTRAYVSDTDADDYFIHTFNRTTWFALSVGEKTIALQEATRWLETLCWGGEKCNPSQPLQWPRKLDAAGCCNAADCTTIPQQLVEATCELALQLHQNQGTMITAPATGQAGTFIKRQKLDVLEVEYDQFAPGTAGAGGGSSSSGPLVLQKFPWLKDLLKCFTSVGSNQLAYVVRS